MYNELMIEEIFSSFFWERRKQEIYAHVHQMCLAFGLSLGPVYQQCWAADSNAPIWQLILFSKQQQQQQQKQKQQQQQ